MNLLLTIWECIIILLNLSIQRCQHIKEFGYLTVVPSPFFLIGSNLTVYCHTHKCLPRSTISLELNGEAVKSSRKFNCTTVMFKLPSVRIPQSIVLCKLKGDLSKIVSGKDLHGGLRPDKPENVVCETTNSSDIIDCSWKRGQETHIPTNYNISVERENGMQMYSDQVQDAENITIPRGIFDKNTKYQLIITAYNRFGASRSDPIIMSIKDIVIPETPYITHVDFGNASMEATLQWKTNESLLYLEPYIGLHTRGCSLEVREGTVLRNGLIKVYNLRPLTDYEFKVRTCYSASRLMHISTPSSTSNERSLCSRWSPAVMGRSPGKGPSQELHVWRKFSSFQPNGVQELTVLWKPPPPEDYSGKVQQYKIFLADDQKLEVICPANSSQCSVQRSADVQTLSVSAVTLYGSSPPADVPLRHSGVSGPVLTELAPAAYGRAVLVSWSWPETIHWSASGEKLLHYVVEWISVPVMKLQWQKLNKNQNNTSITGLTAGVRYNVSVYAVTTRGVSAPSSGLVYSKEQKPVSGPHMSLLAHETRRILIRIDELPVHQQRGFITHYTLYIQKQDFSNTAEQQRVTLPASGPRLVWLDCPEGALALQMTASTAAGESPPGVRISSEPAVPAVGLVIVIIFIIITFFIVNLMCWSCVRERIKQKCLSWGPAWLVESLPKPGNSNAIRLLEQDGGEPSFSSIYSDPPLSPISLICSDKREDMYPIVHVSVPQAGSGQPLTETPRRASGTETMLTDRELDHSYKPQIAIFASQAGEVAETEEEQTLIPDSGEEDVCSRPSPGLLEVLLSSVEVDFSDSPLELAVSAVGGFLWPKTPHNTSVLTRNLGSGGPDSLELHQDDIMTPDVTDPCLPQCTVETSLTDGYFPQVAHTEVDATKGMNQMDINCGSEK
ncbi:interleukin-23 receptor isoform X1 [Echeneis naucrates]|uniref:Interleukin-12 receptor subunit beta-2-like n=1 Tax=Echeneis naucrates TaxID=173247 RepID=A0A665TI22_ECHNA|nr:interleukin-12 receptor subunit beta-2-like isoform X1 [Echeneis naucrates]XP_029356820.1 interleukin-12 receptor subunit beta-2-like isoform X1 [Echeneis naucrates]